NEEHAAQASLRSSTERTCASRARSRSVLRQRRSISVLPLRRQRGTLAVPVEQVDPALLGAAADQLVTAETVGGLALLQHPEVLDRDRGQVTGALTEDLRVAAAVVGDRTVGGDLLEGVGLLRVGLGDDVAVGVLRDRQEAEHLVHL